ncbi:uncharacterized protein BO95DRAFT_275540 [Aspergillus brunneoviolaceus CBS 621.78]|uniref:Uncharacterized protein n=1 Tax=Aspergillus brunneoviolaceus CBS 621.78 TaxID=1450534 RepID=A0ACD1FW70_9EURO|nr:hypothetical protein BO95DRAFT_275540 [Aspergillus brunneoviolaceus CBS 621.78]RAH41176.1 hypothetical protein BO95DRAFT_275540 [Aspergillus brunneoviolaceus CBS 621.78]
MRRIDEQRLVEHKLTQVCQIVHYGLPAAGIILLAVLNQRCSSAPVPTPRPRAIQNLTLLAAELSGGSVVQLQDPNYDLISKVLSRISLQRVHCGIAGTRSAVSPHHDPRRLGRISKPALVGPGPWVLAESGRYPIFGRPNEHLSLFQGMSREIHDT